MIALNIQRIGHFFRIGKRRRIEQDQIVLLAAFRQPVATVGRLQMMANLSPAPVDLPEHVVVLLASGPLPGGKLPPDTAVWLRAAADHR